MGKRVFQKIPQTKTVVALDLEFTDLSRERKIFSIGAIKYENGQKSAEYSSLVNPERSISEQALKVTKINDGILYDKPTFSQVEEEFFAFIEDADEIVTFAPSRKGVINGNDRETWLWNVDEQSLAKEMSSRNFNHIRDKFLNLWVLTQDKVQSKNGRLSLDELGNELKYTISRGKRHTALGDAEFTGELYFRFKEKYPEIQNEGNQVVYGAKLHYLNGLSGAALAALNKLNL